MLFLRYHPLRCPLIRKLLMNPPQGISSGIAPGIAKHIYYSVTVLRDRTSVNHRFFPDPAAPATGLPASA